MVREHKRDEVGIESRIARVGADLSGGVREVLLALPDAPRRARDVERTLGIKKDVASRLVRATDEVDALAAILLMPGPAPLRQVVRSARDLGVSDAVLAPLERALEEFEHLIRDEIGDRVALDGVVSSLLPEAREKQEIFCKQSVYRGMSQIKGACAETMLNASILWPSDEPGKLDGAWLMGWYGLRRMRPGAAVHFATGMLGPSDGRARAMSVDGRVAESPDEMLLEEFSSIGRGGVIARQIGRASHWVLTGDEVGVASAVDVTVANYTPVCLNTCTKRDEPRVNGPTMEISTPCRLAVLDVLVHRDAYVGAEPTLRVYDTAVNGLADMNDPFRDIDRLDVIESLVGLGSGERGVRIPEVPSYREMIDHVLGARGLRAEDFRLYRCRSRYPVYGSQFGFAFPVPKG